MAVLQEPATQSPATGSVNNPDDSVTVDEPPSLGARESESHGEFHAMLPVYRLMIYGLSGREDQQHPRSQPASQPYSIYSAGEKLFILAVAAFAAMFR